MGHSLASKGGCGVAGSTGEQRRLADMAQREAAGIGRLQSLTSDRNMSYMYLCSDRLTGVLKRNKAWRLSEKLAAWRGRFVKFQHYTEYVCGARWTEVEGCVWCVAWGGFGCCNCMDISPLLVEYSEAPPEGAGDNSGGIQWEKCVFLSPREHRFPKNVEHRKTCSSNRHPWVKPLRPLHSDCPPLSSCFHLSLTKSQSTCLCLPSSAPIIHLLESLYHRNTHRKRALLPCVLKHMHKIKCRQTMQIKLRHRADWGPCK